jgi:hypothetical protein
MQIRTSRPSGYAYRAAHRSPGSAQRRATATVTWLPTISAAVCAFSVISCITQRDAGQGAVVSGQRRLLRPSELNHSGRPAVAFPGPGRPGARTRLLHRDPRSASRPGGPWDRAARTTDAVTAVGADPVGGMTGRRDVGWQVSSPDPETRGGAILTLWLTTLHGIGPSTTR